MPATTTPPSGSSHGTPAAQPAVPTSATTEESASERWCHALAISTGERMRVPTSSVARYSHSFVSIEQAATLIAASCAAAPAAANTPAPAGSPPVSTGTNCERARVSR